MNCAVNLILLIILMNESFFNIKYLYFDIQGVLKLLVQTSHTNKKYVLSTFFLNEKTSK